MTQSQSKPTSGRSGSRAAALALALAFAPGALAQSPSEDLFFRAYYLENEGDATAARELYQRVAQDSGASEELRAKAHSALAALAEEAAASDLARLVPEDTIAYVELSEPGERVLHLIEELGLSGEGVDFGQGRLSISPKLVQELLGLRAAAVALTGVDPAGGPPRGVAILHPGNLDIVRGLIETALPAGGRPAASIGGYDTFNIEGMVWVTLTERLVIAGTQPELIEGVLSRVAAGDGAGSLAASESLRDVMALRGEDLLYFCVNPEPVMPMLMGLMESEARRDPGVAMALQLLDPESTQALAGRISLGDDGIGVELSLQLDEDHRNVLFDLMRMPALSAESLGMVPAGAAVFHAAGLNPSNEVSAEAGSGRVALMDLGRELFGNLTHVAAFVLPSATSIQGQPIPDLGLCMRVNDVERSKAIWDLALSIGSMASGSSAPADVEIGGHTGKRYTIEGVGVHVVNCGNTLIVSPSERAAAAALEAAHAGKSILNDPIFAASLQGLQGRATSATSAHAGRLAQLIVPMLSPGERREIEPFLKLLEETTVTLRTVHTDDTLTVTAALQGIPDISDVLGPILAAELGGPAAYGQREFGVAVAAPDYPTDSVASAAPASVQGIEYARGAAALSRAEQAEALADALEEAALKGHGEVAAQLIEELGKLHAEDAFQLNNLAWQLLTEEPFQGRFLEAATELSRNSNEQAQWGNWYYLDTYAHALFQGGQVAAAIELQRKAVAIGEGDPRVAEAQAALERFLGAQEKAEQAHSGR